MNAADLILTKRLTNDEVVRDARFRRAVQSGEYYRCITTFLRIQYPEVKELSSLSRDITQNAQVCVDNAFFEKRAIVKALEREMI